MTKFAPLASVVWCLPSLQWPYKTCLRNIIRQDTLKIDANVRCCFYHHHISVMELGHLLTRSVFTYPEASWKVCPASFRETCQLLKFPLNGLRTQSRVNSVVGLLTLASGPPYLFSFIYKIKRLRWSRDSVLAFSTQVRGFKPGRSRRIFRAKKSSARLPSEVKESRRSHVVDLRHVKDP